MPAQGLHLRPALRPLQEATHPPLRLPRHLHRYVAAPGRRIPQEPAGETSSIITCHLGNGASMAAVDGGKSVDTTMGFTPLEGLVMGTRCGDIDPALVPYIMEREKLGDQGNRLDHEQEQRHAGHLRDVQRHARDRAGGRPRQRARTSWPSRSSPTASASTSAPTWPPWAASTPSSSPAASARTRRLVRRLVCEGLDALGIAVDPAKNEANEHDIGTGSVKVLVVPTNEELAIARDTQPSWSAEPRRPRKPRPAAPPAAAGFAPDETAEARPPLGPEPEADAEALAAKLGTASSAGRRPRTPSGRARTAGPARSRAPDREKATLKRNTMDKIDREEAGWLVALSWLSALEETARDFHGTRPSVFSERAYEHAVQYYLHLLGDEYGMQIAKSDSIRTAVESYIQIGIAGKLFRDAAHFEIVEVNPSHVEITVHDCVYPQELPVPHRRGLRHPRLDLRPHRLLPGGRQGPGQHRLRLPGEVLQHRRGLQGLHRKGLTCRPKPRSRSKRPSGSSATAKDAAAVRTAIIDLGYERGAEVFPVLVGKLDDPNPAIQHAAVRLARRQGRPAIAELVKPKVFRSPTPKSAGGRGRRGSSATTG